MQDIGENAPYEFGPLLPDVDVAMTVPSFIFVRRDVDHGVAVTEHFHDHLLLDSVAVLFQSDREQRTATNTAEPVQGIRQLLTPPQIDHNVHGYVADGPNELSDSHRQLVAAPSETASHTQVSLTSHDR